MTSQIRLFQPFQSNPQRGQIKNCQLCSQKFGVLTKQHQCKRCFRAVCSNCGTTKRDVYKQKMQRSQHRLCKHCNIESTILIEYISINKLKFGQDSTISKRWQDRIPISNKDQLNIKQHKKFTIQIFNQLWDAYNFSLRQFIGLLTYSMGQNQVYKLVNTVYVQLQSRGIQQRMQNLILIIIFLLCFSTTDTCIQLVQYLYSLKKYITDQKQFILVYLKSLGIEDNQSKKLIDYINYKCKQYIGSYSINSVTTQCTIHVISRAFEKNRVDQLFMLLAITLQHNWQYLIKNRNNKNQCDFIIIKNCNMSNYIEKFKQLVSVNVSQFTGPRANIRNSIKLDKQKLDKIQIKTSQSYKQDKISDKNQNKDKYQSKDRDKDKDKDKDDSPSIFNFKKRQSITLDMNNSYKSQIQQNQTQKTKSEENIDLKMFIFPNKNKNVVSMQIDQQSIDGDEEENRNRNTMMKQSQIKTEIKTQVKSQVKTQIKVQKTKSQQEINIPQKKNSNLYESQNLFAQLMNLQPQKQQVKPKIQQKQIKVIQKEKNRQAEKKYKSPQPIPKSDDSCKKCASNQQKIITFQQNNSKLTQELEKVKKQLKISQNQSQKISQQLQQTQKSLKQLKFSQKSQQSDIKPISMQQVINLKNKIQQSQQRQLNMMKQLSKYQKQSKTLKLQVQQLSINNRILKQKLEQNNSTMLNLNSISSSPTRNNHININISQNQDEILRINKMMQKTIQNKNKQLQILTIKNKQLIEKLTQYQRNNSSQNVRQNQKTKQLLKEKQDLIIKMKQLSDIVIKQQSQKLNLSQQLFQLKQIKRSASMIVESKDTKNNAIQKQVSMKSRVSQCQIF